MLEQFHTRHPDLFGLLCFLAVIAGIVLWANICHSLKARRKEERKAARYNVRRQKITVRYLDAKGGVSEGYFILKGDRGDYGNDIWLSRDVEEKFEPWFSAARKREFASICPVDQIESQARYIPFADIKEIIPGPLEDFFVDGNGDEVK